MENPININREMANALRALAVADHGPMADRADEDAARDGLIRQWNTRRTLSEGDGHGLAH